jgi:hypothetical protein
MHSCSYHSASWPIRMFKRKAFRESLVQGQCNVLPSLPRNFFYKQIILFSETWRWVVGRVFDVVSLDEYRPTFRKPVVPSSSGPSSLKTSWFWKWNVENYSPTDSDTSPKTWIFSNTGVRISSLTPIIHLRLTPYQKVFKSSKITAGWNTVLQFGLKVIESEFAFVILDLVTCISFIQAAVVRVFKFELSSFSISFCCRLCASSFIRKHKQAHLSITSCLSLNRLHSEQKTNDSHTSDSTVAPESRGHVLKSGAVTRTQP